jgi:rhodanese-related sulfurtransferase
MNPNQSTNLRRQLMLWVGATVFMLAGAAMAQSETPTTLAGGKLISIADARKLSDNKTAFFVDTRSIVNFGKGHVPGARFIPYKGNSDDAINFDAVKDQFDQSKLPTSKEQSIVFYSDGPTGWKSYKAAVWAIKAGHTNVNYMRSGWTEWQAKGFPVEN